MIGFTEKKQGLHDIIASTYVVKTKDRQGLQILGIILGIVVPVMLLLLVILFGAALFLSMMSSMNTSLAGNFTMPAT